MVLTLLAATISLHDGETNAIEGGALRAVPDLPDAGGGV